MEMADSVEGIAEGSLTLLFLCFYLLGRYIPAGQLQGGQGSRSATS